MYQTVERFIKTLGTDKKIIGVIGDGHFDPKVLTIATFQTLYRRVKDDWPVGIRKWLSEEIGQVHVDEAHHLPAASYSKVMSCLWSARWRFGYSATPYREADPETFFKVVGQIGLTIHHVGSDVLVTEDKLVPADIFMIPVPNHRQQAANYAQDVEEGIVYNGIRNDYIVRLARRLADSNSGPVVILVERLAHGELLARALGCDFVAGDAPTSVRQEAWNGLRNGSLNLLVASRIADEGLDIPPLQFLILAGGGKASHLTIQKVGRGMRPSEGKRNLFVFDWLDEGRWIGKHARKRFDTYRSQAAYLVQETAFEEVVT
jgi:superfamily II DNA or RNA helicase